MNVHEAYSGELLCIVKWLKRLHGTGAGQNFRAIHPDILIFAKSVSFVVPDDPFEVRLRENFELLEDEFLEAEKRSKLIEEKIADLRRTHIMLPSAKVDELYANLKRKNADIYVKRSMVSHLRCASWKVLTAKPELMGSLKLGNVWDFFSATS